MRGRSATAAGSVPPCARPPPSTAQPSACSRWSRVAADRGLEVLLVKLLVGDGGDESLENGKLLVHRSRELPEGVVPVPAGEGVHVAQRRQAWSMKQHEVDQVAAQARHHIEPVAPPT